MTPPIILVAGATGDLGGRIVQALRAQGAHVRATVRPTSDPTKTEALVRNGVEVTTVAPHDQAALTQACAGVSCVVSALSGLRDVIIDVQTELLKAAVAAGVPRFIPSDFALDFLPLTPGANRNLDFRREFHITLDKAPIAATSIFNGPFMDMLTDEIPMILFKQRRILYWGNADQQMDFTTIDDIAAYTACVALDPSTPRYLWIAGDQISARGIREVVQTLTGQRFRMFRPGGLGLLNFLIRVGRTLAPAKKELYPAWQGMQYMRDMAGGLAKRKDYDNARYPQLHWTTVQELLAAHLSSQQPDQHPK
jgi:nucleoside-diphosphate-sugar epimerase